MKALRLPTFALLLVAAVAPLAAQQPAAAAYVPPAGRWEQRSPAAVGMDSTALAGAIAFAVGRESRAPRDLEAAHYQSFGREPFGEAVGPFKPRGAPTGLVIRRGYVVGRWGDPDRVDMTFSVTKSFLSTVVGIAFDSGMIRALEDPVHRYLPPVLPARGVARSDRAEAFGQGRLLHPFDTPHNRTITWDHLLRQTSDWEGTLWGKPEWADRPSQNPAEWRTRARVAPGSAYEYNDVRVNALALAATTVWRRPLPAVLRDHVMGPIGASSTWQWFGYEDSWIVLDGQEVESVSGGGHWGGGMFISAWDMGRFGLLTLRRGQWGDRRILSEEWVRRALTPTGPQPTYGFMNWFLNTDRKLWPSAPAASFGHIGNGTNIIWVSPEHDLVVVARWIENGAIDEFLRRVLASVQG
jgi:CubicO group peptidase (beta-lactamase class C family)